MDRRVPWANVHLLSWLSLVLFVTAWMGEQGAGPVTAAVHGAALHLGVVRVRA